MGIELPAELADVAAKAGVTWPQADEDAMRTSAAAWRDAGAKLSTLAGESDGAAGKALAAMSGPTGEAARGHWTRFTAPDGTLNAVVRGCHAAADRLDHAADQVGAAKVELVRELVNLAKNNDAAQHAANAGHPTALLGLDTAVRGAAANVAHLTDTLTQAVRLDTGVQVGGHQPPVNPHPGVHGPGDGGQGQGSGPGPGSGHGSGGGGGSLGGGQGNGGLLGGLPGAVDGLVGGSSGGGSGGQQSGGVGDGGGGGGAGGGQGRGLVGGLVGGVTDTVDAVAQPVVETVGAVVPPVAAVVDPVLDTTDQAVRAGADAAAPGHSGSAPGRDHAPGLANVVGDVVNPVVGNATAPVADAVTRTEGTVSQSSAAVLDRPPLHTETPHAPAQPAAPAANQPPPQTPTFNSPTTGTPAPPAAAVTQAPAANAAATTQQPSPGQQPAPRAEARAAQAPPPGNSPPGQAQAGPGQAGQGQSTQGQSGQGQGGQSKDAAPAKADGQSKVDGQPKGQQSNDLQDALRAAAREIEDGALAFAVLPIPAGPRDTAERAGPTPTPPPTDAPEPPTPAARNAEPTTEAAALFLLHVFPGGMLPRPSAKPARQLPPPPEDQAFAGGLRFEPQGHPDGHVVDASARIGLDLRLGGPDELRSRLAGAEAVAADPVPAVNRPRQQLAPGTAPDPELLAGYDPLAGMHERDWDRRFLVRADPPEYAWPPGELFPEGGYEEGQPGVLEVGVEVDRFGGPGGRVLSEAGTSFSARSLPPALAHAGYHRYRVTKVLPVWFTLSAEWFGQPGGGVRFRTTYPIADLLALGHLEEVR